MNWCRGLALVMGKAPPHGHVDSIPSHHGKKVYGWYKGFKPIEHPVPMWSKRRSCAGRQPMVFGAISSAQWPVGKSTSSTCSPSELLCCTYPTFQWSTYWREEWQHRQTKCLGEATDVVALDLMPAGVMYWPWGEPHPQPHHPCPLLPWWEQPKGFRAFGQPVLLLLAKISGDTGSPSATSNGYAVSIEKVHPFEETHPSLALTSLCWCCGCKANFGSTPFLVSIQ